MQDHWKRNFTSLVILSIIFSGIAYYIQFYLLNSLNYDKWGISSDAIRFLRMFIIYVIPVLLFFKKYKVDWRELGLLPSSEYPILSTIGGASIYFIAIIVFLKYHIFFGGWKYTPWNVVWIKIIFIGLMASITDMWTRGFILLQLAKKYDDRTAIFWQNVTWFVLHIYEIDLLGPYIGYFGAIVLTLILGVGGDLIALKTKSIFGLMLGHILLNLAIILAAKGVL